MSVFWNWRASGPGGKEVRLNGRAGGAATPAMWRPVLDGGRPERGRSRAWERRGVFQRPMRGRRPTSRCSTLVVGRERGGRRIKCCGWAPPAGWRTLWGGGWTATCRGGMGATVWRRRVWQVLVLGRCLPGQAGMRTRYVAGHRSRPTGALRSERTVPVADRPTTPAAERGGTPEWSEDVGGRRTHSLRSRGGAMCVDGLARVLAEGGEGRPISPGSGFRTWK